MSRGPALLLICVTSACSSTPEDPAATELPVGERLGDAPQAARAFSLARAAAPAGTVTISGRVFYNDRRNHGLFSARDDMAGDPGEKCGTDGVRADGTACPTNYPGGQYMVVYVIERDQGYFAPTAWDCKQEDILQSVAVNHDGTFTATFTPSDACDSDAWTTPRIELRVRLRYCGEWCFSLDSGWNDEYALDFPGATSSAPLAVTAGHVYDVGDMGFYPAGHDPAIAEDYAIAANYYASLVDTVLTIHRDDGVPFYNDEFGEVQYIYPSNETASATTKTASKVVLLGRSDWIKGDVIGHEYGHVLMLRAWDGDYGFDGVGVSWNAQSPQDRTIAWKEGWANFVARVVFVETMACDDADFDDNARKPLPGPLGHGAEWVTNINKALCDWFDMRNDDDATLAGAGDHFAADSFYSMWINLRNMYLDADAYGGDYDGEGLWFCDYVDYYLDVRKSVAAVGAASHDSYVASITDLIYNNNIGCYLAAP